MSNCGVYQVCSSLVTPISSTMPTGSIVVSTLRKVMPCHIVKWYSPTGWTLDTEYLTLNYSNGAKNYKIGDFDSAGEYKISGYLDCLAITGTGITGSTSIQVLIDHYAVDITSQQVGQTYLPLTQSSTGALGGLVYTIDMPYVAEHPKSFHEFQMSGTLTVGTIAVNTIDVNDQVILVETASVINWYYPRSGDLVGNIKQVELTFSSVFTGSAYWKSLSSREN
ncbi:hypothetical protein M0R19_03165 [Candidatus Pacearchaeota archaeon]|jgi:hypothetical protein|nr:hypothetical protein [Candidatus Pacearchaeota archaeon]